MVWSLGFIRTHQGVGVTAVRYGRMRKSETFPFFSGPSATKTPSSEAITPARCRTSRKVRDGHGQDIPDLPVLSGIQYDDANINNVTTPSLNVHISIPVVSKKGIGLNFSSSINFDNAMWGIVDDRHYHEWMMDTLPRPINGTPWN